MKIHPLSTKRNITFLDNHNSSIDQTAPGKLRRLPHIFAKVLELPFHADADVSIEDTPNSVKFFIVFENSDLSDTRESVRAHAVEIYPGIIKLLIRKGEIGGLLVEKIRVDVWRYWLPVAARLELTTAAIVGGELVVTVSKSGDLRVFKSMDDEDFPKFLVVHQK